MTRRPYTVLSGALPLATVSLKTTAIYGEFEEKTYEQHLTSELVHGSRLFFPPGQVFQDTAGFDVALPTSNRPFWNLCPHFYPWGRRMRLSHPPGTQLIREWWDRLEDEIEYFPKFRFNRFVQAKRANLMVDNQVRSLRKRRVIQSYVAERCTGAYWGIRTDIRNYKLPDALPWPFEKTIKLVATPTRLKAMDNWLQAELINWGYAACDAAVRKHVDPSVAPPGDFPCPDQGAG